MPTKSKGRKTSSARSTANTSKVPPKDPGGEVVFYRSPDGVVRLEVPLAQETVWLTQQQMAALFQRERSVITKHINNVFKEGELDLKATCAKFAQVKNPRVAKLSSSILGKVEANMLKDAKWLDKVVIFLNNTYKEMGCVEELED